MALGNSRGAGLPDPDGGLEPDSPWNSPATSGVRPLVREAPADDGALTSAWVTIRTGHVEGSPDAGCAHPVAEVAAALPEIFGTTDVAGNRALGHLQAGSLELQDLVLISAARVHVVQRLPNDADKALVSVAKRGGSIGWIVSESRVRLERA
jgi:hypothetical protein